MPSLSSVTYAHDGCRLSCVHKPASSAAGASLPPLVCVHPVGIGIGAWFWRRLLGEWEGEAWAPDLIGCGRSDL